MVCRWTHGAANSPDLAREETVPTLAETPEQAPDIAGRALTSRGGVIWMTGLSGSGKTTLATAVQEKLVAIGHQAVLLDGDRLRLGLNSDLGFSAADRRENIRRTSEVAALMVEVNHLVIVAAISPFEADRTAARQRIGDTRFIEAFIDASIATCRARDPKGLYAKADLGLIPQFTGIDSPYEVPSTPDLRLPTEHLSVDDCVMRVLNHLRSVSWI